MQQWGLSLGTSGGWSCFANSRPLLLMPFSFSSGLPDYVFDPGERKLAQKRTKVREKRNEATSFLNFDDQRVLVNRAIYRQTCRTNVNGWFLQMKVDHRLVDASSSVCFFSLKVIKFDFRLNKCHGKWVIRSYACT